MRTMAGVWYCPPLPPSLSPKTVSAIRCFSSSPENYNGSRKKQASAIVKIAVSGVTELLRLFSNPISKSVDGVRDNQEEEFVVTGVDEVVNILKSDYENAYFVTGIFTSAIYADDCLFEDPTIRFRGKELYSRNLKLLVPFFDRPSIQLQTINKSNKYGVEFVLAAWKLRTYLKLPWRPLISIDGSTLYELDKELKIVRHAESWSVSALEAITQIFIPSFE
ncbi:uncharacterized protein LOC120079646 isoform X2 [Benincasa hispida]|uniref:uncharacterized protein LOC120079646 isoform X2 n=1 Tax=Benincasa hispida TaxID=102211 RepID=UPI0018FF80C1|nr:uncharacterized protein LOC120079646 isoform X2 [Benincasa hispida]XP_038889844.1 uncharacterized protein LOC120079646 isoform X2 [Benincasa hispida]